MLDDSVMDKKSIPRTTTLQATKNSSSEAKFKQDASSKFSRGPRRTDNSAARQQEATRKTNIRKNKTAPDKRPRPRGSFDRDRSEVVEADLLEAEDVVKAGSKKVNLNHLLNFTLAKREPGIDLRSGHSFSYGKDKLPKYNKEQYLQANCQFVVKEGGNYTINLVDPDKLVDWSLIEQVQLPCYEVPSCPICLYPATAAKITRCGHVYCWVCILHYLALSDHSWHKCPICYEAIHKKDLKSVVSLSRNAPKIGETISLSLMRREKGSLFAVPSSKWTNCPSDHLGLDEDSTVTCFQKLLIANKENVVHIIEQEQRELETQMSNSEDEEVVFYETAFQLLKERQEPIQNEVSAPIKDNEENICTGEIQDDKADYDSDVDACLEAAASLNLNENVHKSFYFYQASDGQHIYLNSLNVRMLIEEYGCLEECPQTLTATIVELDNVTMSKVLRNRLRYLQHLPLTCQFQIVQLHFESPLVAPSTLKVFSSEIEKRRRARTRKQREERRREKHIELEENKKLGKFPGARYSLNSFQHFPTYNSASTDEDPPLNGEEASNNSSSAITTPESLPDLVYDDRDNSTSFAQMLRQGKVRADMPPIKKSTMTSTATKSAPSFEQPLNSDDDEESAPAPEYHLSFGDAIEQAINSMAIDTEKNTGAEKRGKKKKNKNTLLFTTSMNRSK